MELALDIFRTDDFRATEMTEMVGNIEVPVTTLQDMGIFDPVYLRTTNVTLYSKNNQLHLIPTSERGAPEPVTPRNGRTIRQLEAPRLAERDRITSAEAQNMLSPLLPQADRLANATELVSDRMGEMKDNQNITKEFHRLGALQGIVYDADGTTEVVDFYDEFGITKPAAVNFAFGTIPTNELMWEFQENIVIPIKRTLGQARMRPGVKIHALVGDDFWRGLTTHEGVQRLYFGDMMRRMLGEGNAWETLDFGDIMFHHYYGDDAGKLTIASDKAIFFPLGARDVFKVYYTPGEDFGDVNARAKEEYAIVSPDNRTNMNEWVDLYVRSYPLFACLCPQALLSGVVA